MLQSLSAARVSPRRALVAVLCLAAVVGLWARASTSLFLLATLLLPELLLLVALALLGTARVVAVGRVVRRWWHTAWRRIRSQRDDR